MSTLLVIAALSYVGRGILLSKYAAFDRISPYYLGTRSATIGLLSLGVIPLLAINDFGD
jgi:hypothetical protein